MDHCPPTPGDAGVVSLAEANPGLTMPRPAAGAVIRLARTGALLGILSLGFALVVVLRLLVTWHVEPGPAAHRISVFGAHLSYPTANAAALLLLCQAGLGLAVLGLGFRAALRELAASRRLQAWLQPRVAHAVGDARVLKDERPAAFCAGLMRPRVYVTTGALSVLDEHALGAVLEHEREHRRRHDPLRLALGRMLTDALFFLPGVADLSARHESLTELSADEHAAWASPGGRSALARAMLAFSEGPGATLGVGIDPARADALLGRKPDWRFPTLVCLSAGVVLTALILLAVLLGRAAAGSSTLGVPFLSAQPCVLVLALIPAGVGWFAWRLTRPRSTS